MTTPLAAYLRDMRDIHGTGSAVPETSYYGAVERLVNAVGKGLKPTVRLVLHPANRGAGLPDGGLFTADQFDRRENDDERRGKMLSGQSPGRGVVEAKGVGDDVTAIAATTQVQNYLDQYGQVLVTNLRDFLLVGKDPVSGAHVHRDRYTLAPNGTAFWSAAASAGDTDDMHGEQFCDFLRRVLLSGAPLTDPKELATFLASYARDAKARIENSNLPALAKVREALEETLGVSFQGEKANRFFRSTLVQTLFYGAFSAWVLWSRKHPSASATERFDWRTAAWELRVPMIRALFEQVAQP
ncbi:MAG TPA: DNA methyltransferase, partial [Armatimonadota bacterium]|nr:DNA methyltransferase [Armatimonadota bacterium]